MTEEGQPASARLTLPDTVKDYLDTCIEGYGLDAVAQGLRDNCMKRANKHGPVSGPDFTRLTPEQRRDARLWGFAKTDAERFLQAILDHGPGSGCK